MFAGLFHNDTVTPRPAIYQSVAMVQTIARDLEANQLTIPIFLKHQIETVEARPLPASVDSFIYFLGWARSGHSFIGQCLNAHPKVLVANEGLVHEFFDHRPTRDDVFGYLVHLDERFEKANYIKRPKLGEPQNLRVEGSGLSRKSRITSIGNSKAAVTALKIATDPGGFTAFHQEIGLRAKFITITRHPMQIAASKLKRTGERNPHKVLEDLRSATLMVENSLATVKEIGQHIVISHEDFVRDPRGTMRTLLTFLGAAIFDSHLDAVTDAVFDEIPQPSRLFPQLARVEGQIQDLIASHDLFRSYR